MKPGCSATSEAITFEEELHTAVRAAIFLAGLFPFIAPYQLLYAVGWESYLHWFFFLALAVSLGATAVALGFMAVALFGLDQRVIFDTVSRTVVYCWSSPLVPLREERFKFEDIAKLGIETHSWSDGPDYFRLKLESKRGRCVEFGHFERRPEAERQLETLKARIAAS